MKRVTFMVKLYLTEQKKQELQYNSMTVLHIIFVLFKKFCFFFYISCVISGCFNLLFIHVWWLDSLNVLLNIVNGKNIDESIFSWQFTQK